MTVGQVTQRFMGCTIATRGELAPVRVLAQSFAHHHPGRRLVALVVDDLDDELDDTLEPFDALHVGDLSLERDEFLRMAMLYDSTELCAALKPWVLEHLLERRSATVAYLAPHLEVFAALDDLGDAARGHGIVLFPHADRPIPRDGAAPSERTILQEGTFDLDVLAVGPAGRPFLSWWKGNLARDCRVAPELAQFRDQRWVDLVPGFFPCRIERDPTLNVSYWNLHGRSLVRANAGYVVDGARLRLVNFAGFRAEQPYALFHASDDPPRILFSEFPAVATLCGEYAERVRAAVRQPGTEYGFGALADATPIDTRMRFLYREALGHFERGNGVEPPNPFTLDGAERFLTWLRAPAYPELRPNVPRYIGRVWAETPSVLETYRDLVDETAVEYLRWCREAPGLPSAMVPTAEEIDERVVLQRRARPTGPRPTGINLVGYLSAVLGVGEAARSVGRALQAAGVPLAVLDNPGTSNRRGLDHGVVGAEHGAYDTNLLAVNADVTGWLADQLGVSTFSGRRTIGLWFWEVDRHPTLPAQAVDVIDEIWVASEFVHDALRPATSKPIVKVPLPVVVPSVAGVPSRESLGIPADRFRFYFTFDFMSVAERKNPYGVVEAYRRAFRPEDGAALVIKSINGDRKVAELERLLAAAAGRADITILDRYVSSEEQLGYAAHSDAYVSLHRSEGFGFTMAEAMALGKPVIATRYSGNLEFMREDTAYLVDCAVVPVGPGNDPYPPDARWGDPDLDHAAALMRSVFDDPGAARARGARAAADLRATRSVEAVAPRFAELLAATRERAAGAPATWRNHFMRGWRSRANPTLRRNYEYDWLPDGTPVDSTMQRLFEAALARARDGDGRPAPNPDAPDGAAATVAWLNEPTFPPRRPVISRYLLQYWEDHAELQARFPDALRSRRAGRAYVEWVRSHWHAETDIDYRLVPVR